MSREAAPFDPDLLAEGFTLAGFHVEAGARDWTAWSAKMLEDVGDPIRPYLRSMYEAIRYYPALDTAGMSSAADIDRCEASRN